MKHAPILFILFLSFSFLHAQNKTAEQDAIRKVIELETQYYLEGNYDKWTTTWAHEPTSYWEYAGPDFNNGQIGWETIAAGMKDEMKNPKNLSAGEIAARSKKYDYQYKINGNLAHVTYRQGKGNLQTCTLEKQNGEWKITGTVNINTTGYTFKNSLANMKLFLGKWKILEGSYKTESAQPADSNYKQLANDYDIHETKYGIEFTSTNSYTYSGRPYSTTVNENFIPDNNLRQIKYFDFEGNGSNNVTTSTGTASFDTTGQFIVKGMYDDKPTQVRFENIYSFTPDGILHHEGRSYDTNGKVTFKWFFALKRDNNAMVSK